MTSVLNGVRWLCAIEHWTTIVALALVAVLIGQLIGLAFGATSIVKSPRGTVEALYHASQERDYEAAFELLDSDGRALAEAMGPEAWRELVDGLSEGRTIDNTDIGTQRVFGKNAVVGVIVEYTDGEFKPRVEELVREGTQWRVMWPPGTRKFTETVRKYDPWFNR